MVSGLWGDDTCLRPAGLVFIEPPPSASPANYLLRSSFLHSIWPFLLFTCLPPTSCSLMGLVVPVLGMVSIFPACLGPGWVFVLVQRHFLFFNRDLHRPGCTTSVGTLTVGL